MNREKAIRIISFNEFERLNSDERRLYLLNYWPLDGNDEDFYLLSEDVRREMQNFPDEPQSDAANERYDDVIRLSLEASYVSYSNADLSDMVSEITGKNFIVTGQEPVKYACPCCGSMTLTARGEYDVCSVCHWEDDGTADDAEYSSPNHMTLGEYREQFGKSI